MLSLTWRKPCGLLVGASSSLYLDVCLSDSAGVRRTWTRRESISPQNAWLPEALGRVRKAAVLHYPLRHTVAL